MSFLLCGGGVGIAGVINRATGLRHDGIRLRGVPSGNLFFKRVVGI
jgi:hypothetical protein